jgi:hypothetical protein
MEEANGNIGHCTMANTNQVLTNAQLELAKVIGRCLADAWHSETHRTLRASIPSIPSDAGGKESGPK